MQSKSHQMNHAVTPESRSLLRQQRIRSAAMQGLVLLLLSPLLSVHAVTNTNSDSITTTFSVSATDADAIAINATSGSIVTNADGARGLGAGIGTGTIASTAQAINHGTISTTGTDSIGVYADNQVGGPSEVRNEAGATVTTTGAGSRGIRAWGTNGSRVRATNRGITTTRGGLLDKDSTAQRADGVQAVSNGGLALATNEPGGVIRTEGIGARGLSAFGYLTGGDAEAVNGGQITTTGDSSNASFVGLANGIEARSETNSAAAENYAGATVATSGRGARGVYARADGGAGESAIAVNNGAVTVSGGGFHNESVFYIGAGALAYAGEGGLAGVINYDGGVIETTTAATGAFGIAAAAYGGGEARAMNSGRIITRGNVYRIDRAGTSNDTWHSASGINVYADAADASAFNAASGVIVTHGTAATGMVASSDGGDAEALNEGQITTLQTEAFEYEGATFGAHGVYAYSSTAVAVVENRATGRVETGGDWAVALLAITAADGSAASGAAEVRNKGQVVTVGKNAEGVLALARNGGSAANPNRVRAYNDLGATIETTGDKGVGLAAAIQVNGRGSTAAITAYGDVLAQNSGTITTSGGSGSTGAGTFAANGVVAAYYIEEGDTTTSVADAGDVTVINTGTVTANGANATGLFAKTYGDGNAAITVTGGSVTAGHASGIGIWAEAGVGGKIAVTISDGAIITAATAARFDAAAARVSLSDSTLNGSVLFGNLADEFTLSGSTVTGDVDFGGGTDSLILDMASTNGRIDGDIAGLETLVKRGSGDALVNNVAFSGSHVAIEEGRLVFSGHLDVGPSGTVQVNNAAANTAQLAALIVDQNNLPQITAGAINFTGNADIYMQAMSSELVGFAQTAASGLLMNAPTIMSAGTATDAVTLMTASSGNVNTVVGSISTSGGGSATVSGQIALYSAPASPTPPDPTPPPTGGGSGGVFAIGGGAALVALLGYYFDWFDGAGDTVTSSLSHGLRADGGASAGVLTAAADHSQTRRVMQSGLQFWSRTHSNHSPTFAGGSKATVQGYALGINAPLGNGFSMGVSAMPELSAALSEGVGVQSASLSGRRYAVNSSWHGEHLFANASFSYGDYKAQSSFDNTIGGGGLSGSFGMTHKHARLGIGTRLDLAGMRAVPRLAVFDGALTQAAYDASGSALRAEIPAFEQRYRGWKVGMSLSPVGWFNAFETVKWQPNLHLSAIGTHSQEASVSEVRQSDLTGILSFTSAAQANGLPRSIYGISTSVLAMQSGLWKFRAGYAGMIADGSKFHHAVVAGFQLRF